MAAPPPLTPTASDASSTRSVPSDRPVPRPDVDAVRIPSVGRVLARRGLAVATAVATAALVAADLRSLHDRARSLGPEVAVITAARDLPLGTRMTPADFSVVRRPARTLVRDAVLDAARVAGRTLAVPLLAGDVVRARALVPAGRPGLTGLIPVGMRAVRVQPADGSRPPVGAPVDVLAAADPADAGNPSAEAVVVARGATVLATGRDTDGASAVTLLVTEAEARTVVAAALAGRIGLALAPLPAVAPSSPPTEG